MDKAIISTLPVLGMLAFLSANNVFGKGVKICGSSAGTIELSDPKVYVTTIPDGTLNTTFLEDAAEYMFRCEALSGSLRPLKLTFNGKGGYKVKNDNENWIDGTDNDYDTEIDIFEPDHLYRATRSKLLTNSSRTSNNFNKENITIMCKSSDTIICQATLIVLVHPIEEPECKFNATLSPVA